MEFTPINDFIQYLKFPHRRIFHDQVSSPLLYVSLLFVCAFVLNIFAITIVNIAIVDLENIGNVFDELDYGFWAMFGLAVIAAPLGEELIFRFPLKYKIPVSLLISSIIAGFVAYFFYKTTWPDMKYAVPLLLFIVVNYFLVESESIIRKRNQVGDSSSLSDLDAQSGDEESRVDRLFPIFFYLVAMTFAFIHIYNYDSTQFSFWMTPFIVIPQFILALFLGFVRMRVGIWASIYMHALNNFIPLLLYYSVKDLLPPG